MEFFVKISLLLCVFGFFKAFRPSEIYIYEYFTGPDHNFTDEETLQLILPAGVYGTLISLIFVFFLTDLCRYKPMIVTSGIAAIITWSIYIGCESLIAMVMSNLSFGLFMASDVAYHSYIYAKVDAQHYQKVTSYTRGALLAGRCLAAITAQVFVSTRSDASVEGLAYISLASLSFATIWSVFLPSVETSLYFNSKDSQSLSFSEKVQNALGMMRTHFVNAYTNSFVVKWSMWWSLSTCGFIQMEYYIQSLYVIIRDPDEGRYNGAVETIVTFLGFTAAISAGYVKTKWEIKGQLILGVVSLAQGTLVVVMSQTNLIFLCYGFYIIYVSLFHFMVTIASAEIAKKIDEDSYGLVFGFNQFLALCCNTVLTTVVATKGTGFALEPRGQFVVYGSYHLAAALLFICMGIHTCLVNK